MSILSLLKSPTAMGVAGATGAGAAGTGMGVGGWKIYDGVHPTLDKQLTKEDYRWNPVRVPMGEDANGFNWRSWGCVRRLFPKVGIRNAEPEEGTPSVWKIYLRRYTDNDREKTIYFNGPRAVSDNLVTCALADKREGSDGVNFRAEVAVRDDNYGWVMWNGISTLNNKAVSEYRLVLFEKDGEDRWRLKTGWAWNGSESWEDMVVDGLAIGLPQGQNWTEQSENVGSGYLTRKTWAGVGWVDNDSPTAQHLLEGLKAYVKSSFGEGAEFFGNKEGRWDDPMGGFRRANRTYDRGWKKLGAEVDLGDSLEAWYRPFKDKKLSWNTCEEWSRNRRSRESMSYVDMQIADLCYSPA